MNDEDFPGTAGALISRLAEETGAKERSTMQPAHILVIGVTASFAAALSIVLLAAGPRPDFGTSVFTWAVQFKMVAMLLLAFAGYLVARRAVTPGTRLKPALPFAPAALFLLVNLCGDGSGHLISGSHPSSAITCVGTIVAASAPALAVILLAMRFGIPTRPALAGTAAGLLAGTLGALAYTIACVNDGVAFVTLWYGLAIAIVAVAGSMAGSRVLRW